MAVLPAGFRRRKRTRVSLPTVHRMRLCGSLPVLVTRLVWVPMKGVLSRIRSWRQVGHGRATVTAASVVAIAPTDPHCSAQSLQRFEWIGKRRILRTGRHRHRPWNGQTCQRHYTKPTSHRYILHGMPTTKDRAINKCRVPFARNAPFGCFAQKVTDTYLSLIANWKTPLRLNRFGDSHGACDVVPRTPSHPTPILGPTGMLLRQSHWRPARHECESSPDDMSDECEGDSPARNATGKPSGWLCAND